MVSSAVTRQIREISFMGDGVYFRKGVMGRKIDTMDFSFRMIPPSDIALFPPSSVGREVGDISPHPLRRIRRRPTGPGAVTWRGPSLRPPAIHGIRPVLAMEWIGLVKFRLETVAETNFVRGNWICEEGSND